MSIICHKGAILESDITSEVSSADFTFIPWSLDLFIRVPFQLHGEHTVILAH